MPTITNRGKIILSPEEIKFIRDNWLTMTNSELAKALGLRLTRLRNFLAEMGLKRMELEYWTEEQVQFLKDNYKTIGDVEIVEIFSKKYSKNKGWSKKHIEKKRRYLKLKRTPEDLQNIFLRNVQNGRFKICNQKRWEATGSNKIGTIVFWKYRDSNLKFPVIKTIDGYKHYYRWLWIKNFGEITSDDLVVAKKDFPKNILLTIDQLEIIDRQEHARRNTEDRMKYPEEIRLAIRTNNKLKKQLKTEKNVK